MIEIKIGFVGRATNGLEIRNSTIKSINNPKNTIYTTSQDVGGFLGKKNFNHIFFIISNKSFSAFIGAGNLSISKSEIQNIELKSNSRVGGFVSYSSSQESPFVVSISESSITTTDGSASIVINAVSYSGGFIGLIIQYFFY